LHLGIDREEGVGSLCGQPGVGSLCSPPLHRPSGHRATSRPQGSRIVCVLWGGGRGRGRGERPGDSLSGEMCLINRRAFGRKMHTASASAPCDCGTRRAIAVAQARVCRCIALGLGALGLLRLRLASLELRAWPMAVGVDRGVLCITVCRVPVYRSCITSRFVWLSVRASTVHNTTVASRWAWGALVL
jgi:hypothetical protein